MRDREDYIEQWIEHFVKLNNRKPTRQEKMCFKVGWDARDNEAQREKQGKNLKTEGFI